MSNLNELTLDELAALCSQIATLITAGKALESGRLGPVFDLTPGAPITIYTNAVMPGEAVNVSISDVYSGQPEPIVLDDLPSFLKRPPADDLTRAQPELAARLRKEAIDYAAILFPESTEAAPTAGDAEPVDAPLAAEGQAEGATQTAEPEADAEASSISPKVADASAGEAESGGGEVLAAAEAPVAPVPGSASALAAQAGQWAGEWTEDQDARLIGDLVAARLQGNPKAAVFSALALEFARTPKAVELRSYRLKARVEAALAAAAIVQAQTETPEIPAAEVRPDPEAEGDAAVGGHSPAAVQTDDLTAHLLGMTDKGGWSLQRDTDLMELSISGWPAGDIALEIRMQANAIKPRFDALTGLHDDEATGKKVRRWTREQVLDRLQALGKARSAA